MNNIAVASNTHRETARLDLREIVRRLNSALGATMVAALSGANDPKISYRWARKDGPNPSDTSARRLRFAYEQWTAIAQAEGEHVARVWFLGTNPWLDYDTPVNAIREGLFKDVAAATAAMVYDEFSG